MGLSISLVPYPKCISFFSFDSFGVLAFLSMTSGIARLVMYLEGISHMKQVISGYYSAV